MPGPIYKLGLVLCTDATFNTFNKFCYTFSKPPKSYIQRLLFLFSFFYKHKLIGQEEKEVVTTEFWKVT